MASYGKEWKAREGERCTVSATSNFPDRQSGSRLGLDRSKNCASEPELVGFVGFALVKLNELRVLVCNIFHSFSLKAAGPGLKVSEAGYLFPVRRFGEKSFLAPEDLVISTIQKAIGD